MINRYPYTNFHELNLDWILHEISRLWVEVEKIEKQMGIEPEPDEEDDDL